MYNRTLLSKFHFFQGRFILPFPRMTFSTENDSKISLRREQYNLHRFSLPRDSDSFFVNNSRLTREESFYQKFSSGISIVSIIGLLSFPLALFLYLNEKHKSLSHLELTKITRTNSKINTKLTIPVLKSSKSLMNLLDSKTPVIIFYFKNDDHNSLFIKLTRLILEEIKDIYKNELNIVYVDVNNFKGPISQSLKSELSACGSFLYHLLIPSKNEPMLTTLAPLITVESFMDQIIRILDPSTNIKNINSKIHLEDLDNKLSLLRNCLFELELNNLKPDTLIDQHSLESMLKECKRINHL